HYQAPGSCWRFEDNNRRNADVALFTPSFLPSTGNSVVLRRLPHVSLVLHRYYPF
ncbi:hypothetical protein HAX54_034508, partial [Datura stramonium]|nr:hypothetical protein [Datura stramonium]